MRRLRLVGRWGALGAAVALGWPGIAAPWAPMILPALSPHVALSAALALRSVGWLTLVALPVLLLAVALPRWFCRHACPTGWVQELLERLRPSAATRSRRWPTIGPWIVLLTLGGACAGSPLLLWLDPLALFNGFLATWRQPLTGATMLAGLGLPLLLLFDLIWPRVWCTHLCPLGATQDLLALPRRGWRHRFRCETRNSPASAAPRFPGIARRGFLGIGLGAGSVWLLRATGDQTPPPLRPPGAVAEATFTGLCLRCGNCARACPTRIIHPDFGRQRWGSFLTPVLGFDEGYCQEDCHRCAQVCPSGALARLPLAEKRRHRIGRAQVDLDLCLLAQGRECTACVRHCPFDAIAIQTGADGFSAQPRVDASRCNGCGACEAACPTRPWRAVRVRILKADE